MNRRSNLCYRSSLLEAKPTPVTSRSFINSFFPLSQLSAWGTFVCRAIGCCNLDSVKQHEFVVPPSGNSVESNSNVQSQHRLQAAGKSHTPDLISQQRDSCHDTLFIHSIYIYLYCMYKG